MSVQSRLIGFLSLLLVAFVLLLPNLVAVPTWWPWQQVLRLGLDLRGGTHLLYQVDLDQAIENSIDHLRADVEHELRDAQVGAATAERAGRTIQVRFANKEKRQEVIDVLRDRFPNLKETSASGSDAPDLAYVLDEREVHRMHDNFVQQALDVIRNRIDQFGVTEPTIIPQGTDQIVVQLPGIQDPQRAKGLIGKTAQLEFRFLAQGPEAGTVDKPGPGVVVMSGKGDGGGRRQYLVERKVIMTGQALTDAKVQAGSVTEGMGVDFQLDARGGKAFGDATTQGVGRNLAIILDNYVQSAPVIREPITGGRGQITGRFDLPEAQDLANVLRNGALPAPLKLVEERTVGPSLGRDSINKGMLSFAVGSLAVILFMMFYYKVGGLIADLAVIVNIILVLAVFAAFGFTLTMPGIAGIVLTVGMAVDANVLILERIREELRSGKSPRAAIEAGYHRAWDAILDSHVTTFASSLILFQFGAGPVRGFAATLSLGVLASLLTAVAGSRLVYDWMGRGGRVTSVSV